MIKLLFYPQYHLFHKEDREEAVSTRSSEESADEDSAPKESKDANVADRTKRRRTSSVRNKIAMHRNKTENDNGVTALFFSMAERRKGERN